MGFQDLIVCTCFCNPIRILDIIITSSLIFLNDWSFEARMRALQSVFPVLSLHEVSMLQRCELELRAGVGLGTSCVAEAARARPFARVCVQQPGEIVIVPQGWYHSTVNVGEAVGCALVDYSGFQA